MTNELYNQIVSEHADALLRFVLGQSILREEAEDIVQSVFQVLWENRSKVESDKVKSYLFTIAYNKSMDYFRRKKRRTVSVNLDFDIIGLQPDWNIDLRQALQKALMSLSHDQRSCVMLKDWEGYSYQEIGEILQLNLNQVKVTIFRARMKLKEQLKPYKS